MNSLAELESALDLSPECNTLHWYCELVSIPAVSGALMITPTIFYYYYIFYHERFFFSNPSDPEGYIQDGAYSFLYLRV